ncbi:MAG: hypothetical protein WDN75_05235 [Bacteroidota bacterium]
MKELLLIVLLLVPVGLEAQNTFPSSGNVGIGTSSPTDQLEVVNGYRRVTFNSVISGVSAGGILSLSRPDDGARVLNIGGAAAPGDDQVIFASGGSTELRFVSAGGSSEGFGFYTNQSFFRPLLAVADLTGNENYRSGSVGIGTSSPLAKLHVNGLGGSNVDLTVNGRITSGDSYNAGGIYLNSAQSMFWVNTLQLVWEFITTMHGA